MASVDVMFNNERVMHQILEKDVYIIGRQEGCDIRIDNLGISRNHARIVRDGSGWIAEDLKSSNGTFVNGEQVERHHLNEGDEIAIGKYIITFSESGVPAESTAQDEAAAQAAPIGGGDALNTMAMDGDAIRKRLQQMHKEKGTEAGQATAMPAPGKAPDTEKTKLTDAEMKAREAEIQMLEKRLKTTKMIVAAVVVLIIGAGVAAYFMLAG